MYFKHCLLIFVSTILLTACLGKLDKKWQLDRNADYIEVDGETYKVSKFVNQSGYHSVPTKVPLVSMGVPLNVGPNNLRAIEMGSGCSVDPLSIQNEGFHTRAMVICD